MATAAHGQAPTAAAELVMINFEISRKPRVAAVTCHQQAAVLIATHLVGLSGTNFTIINNNIYQHQGGRGVSVARRKNQKHRQMLCSMQLPIILLSHKQSQDSAQGRQIAGKKQIHHCKHNNNTLVRPTHWALYQYKQYYLLLVLFV